jgi:hypothetical protein
MADNVPAVPPSGGNGEDPITGLLMRAATDPAFDSSKFETAVSFLRERERKVAHRAFNAAMAQCQSELESVPRDARNDHLRSRYASLDGMLSVILPAASRNGLHVRFGSQVASEPGYKCITCTVSHDAGHEEVTALEGPVLTTQGVRGGQMAMNALQAVGSTVTYLKRYLLGMVFSLVLSDEQDDDGGGGRGHVRTPPPPSRPPFQADGRQTDDRPVDERPPAYDRPTTQAPPPPPPPPPPKRTVSSWMEEFRVALDGARSAAEALEILDRGDIEAAKIGLQGDAQARYQRLVSAAQTKWSPPPQTPPQQQPQAPRTEAPKVGGQLSTTEWLDALEMAVDGATSAIEISRVITHDDVMNAREVLEGAESDRLATLLRKAMRKGDELENQERGGP